MTKLDSKPLALRTCRHTIPPANGARKDNLQAATSNIGVNIGALTVKVSTILPTIDAS
jgi:hypothetical protein